VPEVLTGADAVNFILTDLDAAIAGLPSVSAGDSENLAEVSKAAARYLKAKVLLNRHVYENQLTGGGGTPAAADMQEVVNLVDAIAADGFALEEGAYFEIFEPEADTETIWYADNANTGNRIFNGLHYNSTSLGGGGWNGFSTLAEFYDLFEGDPDANALDGDLLTGTPLNNQELRRGGVPNIGIETAPGEYEEGSNVGKGFLVGQQYALDGTELQDRQGNPLAFTRDFVDGDGNPNLINNSEVTGIRVQKYQARIGGGFQNHIILFRYSDAHLMKAEAIFRGASGDALSVFNDVRRAREVDELGSLTEQDLLDERGRELYIESWRRNDMIRFGQYLRQWEFKSSDETGNTARLLFPIPLPQLLANPNLVQNPGY
jgi:hypothetical protein